MPGFSRRSDWAVSLAPHLRRSTRHRVDTAVDTVQTTVERCAHTIGSVTASRPAYRSRDWARNQTRYREIGFITESSSSVVIRSPGSQRPDTDVAKPPTPKMAP